MERTVCYRLCTFNFRLPWYLLLSVLPLLCPVCLNMAVASVDMEVDTEEDLEVDTEVDLVVDLEVDMVVDLGEELESKVD